MPLDAGPSSHHCPAPMKTIITTAALLALTISAPAAAGPYVGLEVGTAAGKANDVDEYVSWTTTQTPATPLAPAGPADGEADDVFNANYKRGSDLAVTGGYDFGRFRLEVELGRKSVGIQQLLPDDIGDSFLADFNAALNRPSAAPDPGAPGLPALGIRDFDLSGRMRVHSIMANALVDLGITDRLTAYGGGGLGRSQARALGDTDGALAWQYMLGARYAITPNIDLGLKYRFFNSGIIKVQQRDEQAFAGNPNRLSVASTGGAPVTVDQTTSATLIPELEGEFRTRSWLATLNFNF